MKRAAGVTLVELLVVMAIVGITLGVVGPRITTGLDGLALTTSGQRLAAAMKSARNLARSNQRTVYVNYSGNRFEFIRGDQTVRVVELGSGVQVNMPATTMNLAFLNTGQIVGPNRLELKSDRGRRGTLILRSFPGIIQWSEGQ